MGSEESKPSKAKNSSTNQIDQAMMQRALEQQRRLYEERFNDLIENQIRINTESNAQNPINRTNVANTTTNNVLYPSLGTMTYNNLATASGNTPYISNSHIPPSTSERTTSPLASAHATMSYAVNNNQTCSNTGAMPKQRISGHTTSPLPSAPPAPLNAVNNNQGVSNKGAIPKQRLPPKVNNNIGVECVTCKKDFGAQIFQCTDGHSSCNNCRFLLKRCGICSKFITDIRNITLEGTIADIKLNAKPNERIKCHNARDGCSLSFTASEIESHLAECPYSDIICPLNTIQQNCFWRGKANQIINHFKDTHPQCVADVDSEMNLNIQENKRIIYLVVIGSFNFLVNIEVKLSKKMMYIVAQLLGTKVSASKWEYEIHIYNKRQPKRKFRYVDTCHSNTLSVQDIFNNFQSATLNIDYARTFAYNGCLTYKFFLKRNAPCRRRN